MNRLEKLGKENSIIRAEKSGIGALRIGQKNQVTKLSGCGKKKPGRKMQDRANIPGKEANQIGLKKINKLNRKINILCILHVR